MFLCYKHATWRWYLTLHIFDTFCRPTIFIEVIQRVGCMEKNSAGVTVQKGGCGGFGKGNFSELFKSIEEYEKTLDGTLQAKSE
jgi:4-hydroxyphenylpyruvate dioxygenase-like putative hemolysin